jgi:ubiquinone/menaquinone biosynthesis C-methylase UbiE
MDEYGHYIVDDAGRLLVKNGGTHVALSGVFAYGLGSGMTVNNLIGGEPSFQGRVDSVWLYNKDIGRVLLEHLLPDPSVLVPIGIDPVPEVNRSTVWHKNYSRKALSADQDEVPLHVIGGYDLFSLAQWDAQIATLFRGVPVRSGESVLEVGVGAGALLDSLTRIFPGIRIGGCDYCAGSISIARKRLKGEFFVADCRDLNSYADASWDHVVLFGVLQYLTSLEDVTKTALEMLRVCKPGGICFIGEISDTAKENIALDIRAKTHGANVKLNPEAEKDPSYPSHLYTPQSLWHALGEQTGQPRRSATTTNSASPMSPRHTATQYT